MKRNSILPTVLSIVLIVCTGEFNLNAQIRTTGLPEAGFEGRIKKAIDNIWIIDTHEHLQLEETMLERVKTDTLDFTHLFQHYIIDDLISAGYSPFVQKMVNNKSLPVKDRWEILEPFWKATSNTGYAKAEIITARDLFGINEISSENVEQLSRKIHDSYKPGWYRTVLKDSSRIDLSILDVGHIEPDHDLYYHVERFDNFIFISSGSEIKDLGKNYKVEIESLDDFVAALRNAFQEGIDYGMIGVKSGLAYSRKIHYENTSKADAETVFKELISENSESPPDFERVKPLQDYMMHRILDLAEEYDLPVQIHTGLLAGNRNEIRNSKPTDLTNLFISFPDVQFLVMHSSYPYGGELSVLAKNFPNVNIDMCWSQIISPYYCERYLHEWLETVPVSKIMAFGGDYNHVESIYGHSIMAREVIAKVLIEKVTGGYFSEEEAIDVAGKLLRENALEIFKLNGRTRDLSGLPSLTTPGFTHDLWEMMKSGSGLIRDWMVIGPFPIGTGDFLDDVPPPGFEKIYPPEKEIEFNRVYNGKHGEIRWQKARTGDSGILDFKSMFPDGQAIVYAYAEIGSPDKRKMKITFGSDDGAKVWINGKLVYNEHAWRALGWDGDIIEADLKKGINSILVKVEDKWLGWEMMMRILDINNELEIVNIEL